MSNSITPQGDGSVAQEKSCNNPNAYVTYLEASLKRVALTELDTAKIEVTGSLIDAPRTSSVSLGQQDIKDEFARLETELKPFISCMILAKQLFVRAASEAGEGAQVQYEPKTCATWSNMWVSQGAEKLETCEPEQKEEIESKYQPFDVTILETYLTWLLFLHAQGSYDSFANWSLLLADFICGSVIEATLPKINLPAKWALITSTLLKLPSASDLSNKMSNPEELKTHCENLDKLNCQFTCTVLNEVFPRKIGLNDSTHLSTYVSAVVSGLWLLFRYFMPRQLSYHVSNITLRNNCWNELMDHVSSDNTITVLELVAPELLRYIAILGLALKRRADSVGSLLMHQATSDVATKDVYTRLLIAVTSFDVVQVEKCIAEATEDSSKDFLLSGLSPLLMDQIKYRIFEMLNGSSSSIDHQSMCRVLHISTEQIKKWSNTGSNKHNNNNNNNNNNKVGGNYQQQQQQQQQQQESGKQVDTDNKKGGRKVNNNNNHSANSAGGNQNNNNNNNNNNTSNNNNNNNNKSYNNNSGYASPAVNKIEARLRKLREELSSETATASN